MNDNSMKYDKIWRTRG